MLLAVLALTTCALWPGHAAAGPADTRTRSDRGAETLPSRRAGLDARQNDPLAALNPEWKHGEIGADAPNLDRLWMGLAIAVSLAAGGGLLLVMKRLGVVPSTQGSSQLALQATLQLRPGMTLHLVGAEGAELLVAADQRGIQSVTTLKGRFLWEDADVPEEIAEPSVSPGAPGLDRDGTASVGAFGSRRLSSLSGIERPDPLA